MITAVFLVLFSLCGPTDIYCEEGRMTHHSCAAAEAWLRAGLRPGQALLVSACDVIDQQNPDPAAVLLEEPALPLLSTREAKTGGN